MIFILGYVMDEGEYELHPRLDQHHISCRGDRREETGRRREVRTKRAPWERRQKEGRKKVEGGKEARRREEEDGMG